MTVQVDTDFSNDLDVRVMLLVHDTRPPFLDGRVIFTKQAEAVMPLRDPTSDLAVIAKTGSKLVKEIRDKKNEGKSRQRFWEVAGSKMGKITGWVTPLAMCHACPNMKGSQWQAAFPPSGLITVDICPHLTIALFVVVLQTATEALWVQSHAKRHTQFFASNSTSHLQACLVWLVLGLIYETNRAMPAVTPSNSGKGPTLLQGHRLLHRRAQASPAQTMQALLHVTGGIDHNNASNAVFDQPLQQELKHHGRDCRFDRG